ncbi:MAG: SDH family Clp fold serine proteinase, partial [Cytophagaceae bacterium]
MKTSYKKIFRRFLLLLAPIILLASIAGTGQQSRKKVFIMEIRKEIDPRMSRYVELALDDAKEQAVDLVIIDMDTYGGAVNDADKIRTLLLDFETPIYVFINKNAASAGALISIACDSIYMAPGSNIGAATV